MKMTCGYTPKGVIHRLQASIFNDKLAVSFSEDDFVVFLGRGSQPAKKMGGFSDGSNPKTKTAWGSTLTVLLVRSSFSRKNGHPLLQDCSTILVNFLAHQIWRLDVSGVLTAGSRAM